MSTTTSTVIAIITIIAIPIIITLSLFMAKGVGSPPVIALRTDVASAPTPSTPTPTPVPIPKKVVKSPRKVVGKPCTIKAKNARNQEETITVGAPWFLDENNPKRCFAPVHQKCCDQITLPSGEEGCMADFSGMNPTAVYDWKFKCTNKNAVLDMDKLGLLSKYFSGEWVVSDVDGSSVKDMKMGVNVDGKVVRLKKNGKDYGVYDINNISVNPTKEIRTESVAMSGTKTRVLLVGVDDKKMTIREIQTAPTGEQNKLTTYTLAKV